MRANKAISEDNSPSGRSRGDLNAQQGWTERRSFSSAVGVSLAFASFSPLCISGNLVDQARERPVPIVDTTPPRSIFEQANSSTIEDSPFFKGSSLETTFFPESDRRPGKFESPLISIPKPDFTIPVKELGKVFNLEQGSEKVSPKPIDIEMIRAVIKDELQHAPMSKNAKILAFIGISSFVVGLLGFARWLAKRSQDFDSMRRDIENILPSKQRFLIEEPKSFIVKVCPSDFNGNSCIYEVDDPRISFEDFDPKKSFGPYSVESLKIAVSRCRKDHNIFPLDYVDSIRRPIKWTISALGRLDFAQAWRVLTSKLEVRDWIEMKIKITVEKAAAERARERSEGRPRDPTFQLATLVYDRSERGWDVVKFFVCSEETLQLLGDRDRVEQMKKHNPLKIREIELAEAIYHREMSARKRSKSDGVLNPHIEGHFRSKEPAGGYLVPVIVYVKPSSRDKLGNQLASGK